VSNITAYRDARVEKQGVPPTVCEELSRKLHPKSSQALRLGHQPRLLTSFEKFFSI